jgi:predicted small lipoprotein YifL
LASDRRIISLGVAAALLAAGSLSACGRNGGLELPPGPAGAPPAAATPNPSPAASVVPGEEASPNGTPQDVAARTGFDARGRPVAGQAQGRSFILDPLLR